MLVIPLLLANTELSTVAIELPDDASVASVQSVIQSCNQALGDGRCRTAGEAEATLYAIVQWQGSALVISLRRGAATNVELEHRSVEFSPDDAPSERWTATGLMVAAMTAAHSRSEPATPETQADSATPDSDTQIKSEAENPTQSKPKTEDQPRTATDTASETESPDTWAKTTEYLPPPTATADHHLGIDLGALVAPAPGQSNVKWGGELQLAWFAQELRVGLVAGGSHQRATKPVHLSWTTGSLGLMARPTPWDAPVGVELAAEATLLFTRAEVRDEGAADSDRLWQLGGSLRATFLLPTRTWVEPYAGLGLTLAPPGIDVRVAGESVGAESSLRLWASLGLRLKPL